LDNEKHPIKQQNKSSKADIRESSGLLALAIAITIWSSTTTISKIIIAMETQTEHRSRTVKTIIN